jgi:F5/8 type C domain
MGVGWRAGRHRFRIIAGLLLLLGVQAARADTVTVLDDFETLSGWSAQTSDPGVKVELASDAGQNGMAMRIDFTFESSGGHVLVRKPFALDLPSNYAFTVAWRGVSPPIDFEFKLIDRSERNVWWYRLLDATPPTEWSTLRIKKPRIVFAWGPLSGGAPRAIAFVEFAITGAVGDHGSLWLDDLKLEQLPVPPRAPSPPTASASTSLSGEEPAAVLDDNPFSIWHSGELAPEQWLQFDFGSPREYGGLVVDWDPRDYAVEYDVEASDDGQSWNTIYRSTRGNGRRDYIFLPEGESRLLRLAMHESSRGQGYGIRALRVIPLELATSPNQFIERIARDSAPGSYPRYFSGQQTYWTVVGVNGDDHEALLGEDGMLEVDKGGFSIQPFLLVDGALVSWNEVDLAQELEDGYLPIPSVRWSYGDLSLTITAVATGAAADSLLLVRYRLENRGDLVRDVKLFLVVWPFQVLPPWQSLNMIGGVSSIHELFVDARTLWVNRRWEVIALTPPTRAGASTTDEGPIAEMLAKGVVPERTQVSDGYGFASAALEFDLHVPAGGQQGVYIAVPFHDADPLLARSSGAGAEAEFERAFVATKAEWRRLLNAVDFAVPESARDIVRTLRTTLGYILVNRSGPALQPGSRTYSRAWIRDGAMISAALLEMAFTQEVRDFIRWYAGYQYPDGKVPCCVDRHGADPLPENDSDGEFLYAIAEYYRFTRDIGFVNELWPNALNAVRHIESLRGQRLGEAYTKPGKRAYYGLLPESISHEGYAAHPVHSYWDDFFALRGLKDAVVLATVMGDADAAARIGALRDALQHDVHASIAAVITERKLDYVPASVELGDYDPSATAIALRPGGEQARLPAPQTAQTFQRYYEEVERRRSGADWDVFAPYELRTVGALVRLDGRDQALTVLEEMLAARRPLAWNQWPEIVWHDERAPRFIGDMPHTWIGSDYVSAVRDLFAYEREDDRALVLAAGIPAAWLGDDPVGVRRLPTYFGVLSYDIRRDGPAALRMHLSGDLGVPPGGLILQPPLSAPLTSVTVNGRTAPAEGDHVRIDEFPAEVVLTSAELPTAAASPSPSTTP